MLKYKLFIITFLVLGTWSLNAQTRVIPAPAQEGPILLKGATAHLGNGQVIEKAVLGFDQGKITVIGAASSTNVNEANYTVVDLSGKHIYPGFILFSTNLGLNETGSTEDTKDFMETGSFNANARSIVAYNTDSELIPTMRFMGILMAQTTPMGGTIAGSSSVVQLDAWNWEDAAYETDDAMHVNWPTKSFGPRWWLGETQGRKNPGYDGAVQNLKAFFKDAQLYHQAAGKAPYNLKMEGMKGLFDGSKALHYHVDDAKSTIAACQFAKEFGIDKIVVIGGREAYMITDFLKENDIPVVLTDIHSLPDRAHDHVVLPYKMPKMLKDAGVEFCITDNKGMTSRQRNLPFAAGTAVAHGLSQEEAIKAITGDAADILGIGDRVGTLEKGKDATLFVSTGDALDMRTNNVEHAFIQGRAIQINARQQFLYKKYSDKYGHQTYLTEEKKK